MKLTLSDNEPTPLPKGVVIYSWEEHSFDVKPAPTGAFASVLVKDLNIELDQNRRVVSVWGLCHPSTWKSATLRPPQAQFREVFVMLNESLEKGVSIVLAERNDWEILADASNGWVCFEGLVSSCHFVSVLDGLIFGVAADMSLASVWLKLNQS